MDGEGASPGWKIAANCITREEAISRSLISFHHFSLLMKKLLLGRYPETHTTPQPQPQ